MADWRAITAQRLAGLHLPEPRREQVVQQLSEHLEDEFAARRERLPEDEAERRTLTLLDESDVLIREIRRAEREDAMNQAARIPLCGIVTGAALYPLGLLVFVFALNETAFATAIDAARAARHPFPALPYFVHLAGGIWTMWLYWAIRPRYGAGPKTAVVAGVALWVVSTLIDLRLVSEGVVPVPLSALMAPVPASLPVAVLATMAGAWAFERKERVPFETFVSFVVIPSSCPSWPQWPMPKTPDRRP